MKRSSFQPWGFFEKHGRQGGLKRARRLSKAERSAIASRAARARWQTVSSSPSRPSIRLNKPEWSDPVYLAEILAEGSPADWRRLYAVISDRPFGPAAVALEQVLRASWIYGITPL